MKEVGALVGYAPHGFGEYGPSNFRKGGQGQTILKKTKCAVEGEEAVVQSEES